MYKGQSREDTRPHIFAMADQAFRNLVEGGENQSILVTYDYPSGQFHIEVLTSGIVESQVPEKPKIPKRSSSTWQQ